MSTRRIVICIDGTNNCPGAGMTNVQRLNRMLARSDEQVVYYQPGVGTVEPGSLSTRFGRHALMLVDAMSAIMLRRHVCSAYRFLMAEYREGDRIYGFGFSRGAYTVRVLAGMLRKVGLLHRGQDELVDPAWEVYTRRDNHRHASEFRNAYSRFIPAVRFLGLFDTVSAVGTPWRPRSFDYTFANNRVDTVRHAVSLDEHRVMFVQNLWAAPGSAVDASGRCTDVRQVWFAGAHADVGGGYPDRESGLSLIPLAWMRDHAAQAGLEFRPKVSARILFGESNASTQDITRVVETNACAPAHDELAAKPGWRLLEWLPVPRWRPDGQGGWIRRWRCHRARAREAPAGSLLHFSVEQRCRGIAYQPRCRPTSPQTDRMP